VERLIETRPFFPTSGFVRAFAAWVALMLTTIATDSIDAVGFWLVPVAIAAGYIVSRGFAKARGQRELGSAGGTAARPPWFGLLITTLTNDDIDARRFWELTVALLIGYMLSRGIAKSGTKSRSWDPREDPDLLRRGDGDRD
jgi:hypothetical protein